jgi:gamma-glutamyltranspeptidase / glutathione hydrolase
MLRKLFLQMPSTTRVSVLLASGLLLSSAFGTDDPHRNYAGSATVSRFGIVATSQTLASQAGVAVLERGGNAVDAAVAANAALGVIEPMMNGVGGDLFAIVYESKTGKVAGINSSGWAPKGTSIEYLKAHGVSGKIPQTSVQAVTVPGTVAGWAALRQKFGKLPLKDDLAPAIYLARNGFPVSEMNAQAWKIFGPQYQNAPGFAKTFLPEGQPLAAGEVFQNADLARTLEHIANEGASGFYRGPVAAAMVDFLDSLGSPMSKDDLAEFAPEWVEPISTTYHGWTVRELPPNGQGIAALEMLNIMEGFPLKEYGHNSVQALHIMIEAKKLAYADLARYVADQRFSKVPVSEMVSKSFAEHRAKLIGATASCQIAPAELTVPQRSIAATKRKAGLATRADLRPPHKILGGSNRIPDSVVLTNAGRDTTYLTVVDRDGNIVSLIQSNSAAFGTGLVAPGTGFVLQNRGSGFSLEPNHPNVIAPRKRPFHTIIPALLSKSDITVGFGIMGGLNQPQAHAQFVSNIVDFGMDLQAALDAPRFTKPTFNGCDVLIESRLPEAVRAELAAKGHKIHVEDEYSQKMGRGNAVMVDARGVKFGASDPRGDGEAIPETPKYW